MNVLRSPKTFTLQSSNNLLIYTKTCAAMKHICQVVKL